MNPPNIPTPTENMGTPSRRTLSATDGGAFPSPRLRLSSKYIISEGTQTAWGGRTVRLVELV